MNGMQSKVTSAIAVLAIFVLGLIATAQPALAAGPDDVVQAATNSGFGVDPTFAAVRRDGTLWMWGGNDDGQIGDGTNTHRNDPVKVLTGVSSVSMSEKNTFAVKSDGSLWTWGYNFKGSLGTSDDQPRTRPTKVMDGVAKAYAIGSGGTAIKKDGTLWRWGNGSDYQIGDGTYGTSIRPVKVLDNVAQIASNGSTFAALKRDGTVWTWGSNLDGLLGAGNEDRRFHQSRPVQIASGVSQLVEDWGFNAGFIKDDGTLWMWGRGVTGSLGDGTSQMRTAPVKVLDDVKQVSISSHTSTAGFTLAVKKDGSLWSWGYNVNGELGNGNMGWGAQRNRPGKIMDGVVQVFAGDCDSTDSDPGASIALKADGSVWTWGGDAYGMIGNGSKSYEAFQNKATPVKIMAGVSAVYAKGFDAAVIKSDGSLWAWGDSWFHADGASAIIDAPLKVLAGGGTTNPTPSTGFADVPANNWVYTEGWLKYVSAKGLMGGYNGNFAPEGNLTRGQVAAVLYRVANPESDATTNPAHYGATTGFADGGSQHYYFAAVKWLKEKGISTGDKNPDGSSRGTFRPDANITRQELATMVYRFAQEMGIKGGGDTGKLTAFRDGSDVQPYAREAMAWCNDRGIITGGKGSVAGLVMPGANATRGQAAKIFTVLDRDVLKR